MKRLSRKLLPGESRSGAEELWWSPRQNLPSTLGVCSPGWSSCEQAGETQGLLGCHHRYLILETSYSPGVDSPADGAEFELCLGLCVPGPPAPLNPSVSAAS